MVRVVTVAIAISALGLDWDGTLVDSEDRWYNLHRACFEPFGISLAREDHKNYWMRSSRGTEGVCADYGLDITAVRKAQEKLLPDVIARITPADGAQEFIERFYTRLALAIVSYERRSTIEELLGKFGWRGKIKGVVSYNDVKEQKPHPESYMRAAELVGPLVAVEDTIKGGTSAKSAGYPWIAVPNGWTAGEDFESAGAARVVSSLNDITLEMIKEIGQAQREQERR